MITRTILYLPVQIKFFHLQPFLKTSTGVLVPEHMV